MLQKHVGFLFRAFIKWHKFCDDIQYQGDYVGRSLPNDGSHGFSVGKHDKWLEHDALLSQHVLILHQYKYTCIYTSITAYKRLCGVGIISLLVYCGLMIINMMMATNYRQNIDSWFIARGYIIDISSHWYNMEVVYRKTAKCVAQSQKSKYFPWQSLADWSELDW